MQPIIELSSAEGRCAVRAVNILGNWLMMTVMMVVVVGRPSGTSSGSH